VAIGGLFIFTVTGVAYVCGALSNVWFWDLNKVISIASTVTAATPKGNPDAVIPNFIMTSMPWFNAIFMVTLLAAAMSTMSSQVHTMGTSLGRDVIETGTKFRAKKGNWVVRIAMLAGIALSALLAWYLPVFFGNDGSAVIAIGTSLFFGLCASTFLPLFTFGLFWKGATKEGAVWGFSAGLGVSILWLLFFAGKVAASLGFCHLLFGVTTLAGTGWVKDLDPIIVATPIGFLATWLVSLATRRTAT
jgi:SSS family solute:Na+ symporter